VLRIPIPNLIIRSKSKPLIQANPLKEFASGYILLATALQHGALYGIETVEDFARFDLSSGPSAITFLRTGFSRNSSF
jgi:hypothetical protein